MLAASWQQFMVQMASEPFAQAGQELMGLDLSVSLFCVLRDICVIMEFKIPKR